SSEPGLPKASLALRRSVFGGFGVPTTVSIRAPSPYAPSAGIASCSKMMFLLQMVQTMEPNASPSALRKRLKRITRPQHTGIQTFWELSALIGRHHLPGGQSIYRKHVLPRIAVSPGSFRRGGRPGARVTAAGG